MKNKTAALLMALGLDLPAVTFNQDANPAPGPRGPRPPREGEEPRPPRFEGRLCRGTASAAAVDCGAGPDHDGVINADEIAKASESRFWDGAS